MEDEEFGVQGIYDLSGSSGFIGSLNLKDLTRDFSRALTTDEIQDYLEDLAGVQEAEATPKPKPKPEQVQNDLHLNSTQFTLVSRCLANYEKGLRLYILNVDAGVFAPFGDSDSEYDPDDTYVWLMPKIAEKVRERIDSLRDLDAQCISFKREIESKRQELGERIELLLKNGHDHMI
jgi:hypothetical protein